MMQASSRRIASTIAVRRTPVLVARSTAGLRSLSTASSSHSSSAYSRFTSSRTPLYTLGLVGGIGAWFGLSDDKKDDKHIAGGALKHNKKVDYDQVYRDIGAFSLSLICFRRGLWQNESSRYPRCHEICILTCLPAFTLQLPS